MKTALLQQEVQEFIEQNLASNVQKLALKKSPFSHLSMADLLPQIESKQRAKNKLPLWYATKNILFPSKLSIEQTSSEPCAQYKANLVKGDSLVDLTGGFGIDSYYFSKNIEKLTHIEIQEELSQIAQHNFKEFSQTNIECICANSIEYIRDTDQKWDYIYLDPARRNDAKQKVFLLSDCTPNVVEHLDLLFSKTNTILVKTAPLLDIQAGLKELSNVKQVHIVALNNEVKELLWVIEKDYTQEIELIAVNIQKDKTDSFTVCLSQECSAKFEDLSLYLYEPNAALLKTGKFDCISAIFNIGKLHQHSHLYTGSELISFPGRSFKVLSTHLYNKANTKEQLQGIKANLTTRNFPLKVEEIRKKWKVKEGGDIYIFFTTLRNEQKVFIICQKI
ncbi:THUMP-like domain-containing protein [Myroides sp. LJL115]